MASRDASPSIVLVDSYERTWRLTASERSSRFLSVVSCWVAALT